MHLIYYILKLFLLMEFVSCTLIFYFIHFISTLEILQYFIYSTLSEFRHALLIARETNQSITLQVLKNYSNFYHYHNHNLIYLI